jgi:hypothetical protein
MVADLSGHRQLPPLNEFAVLRKFITTGQQSTLLDWAEEQFAAHRLKPNPAGPNRYFATYEESDHVVPDLFWQIRRRAVSSFSVAEYEDEPRYKCFLGCNTEGGFIQEHRDPSPPGMHHVRMNIMLSKPIDGGRPVVNGRRLVVHERDLWCFYPTLMRHSSTPLKGTRKRFVL